MNRRVPSHWILAVPRAPGARSVDPRRLPGALVAGLFLAGCSPPHQVYVGPSIDLAQVHAVYIEPQPDDIHRVYEQLTEGLSEAGFALIREPRSSPFFLCDWSVDPGVFESKVTVILRDGRTGEQVYRGIGAASDGWSTGQDVRKAARRSIEELKSLKLRRTSLSTASPLRRYPVETAESMRAKAAESCVSGPRQPVEGIWMYPDQRYEVAVVRGSWDGKSDYGGFVIESSVAGWEPGDAKMLLRSTPDSTAFAGSYFVADHTEARASFETRGDALTITVPTSVGERRITLERAYLGCGNY